MNRQSFEASRTKVGIAGFLPRSQGSSTHPPTGQRMAKAPKLAAAPFSRFAYLHGLAIWCEKPEGASATGCFELRQRFHQSVCAAEGR
jgi:hypothetical protein